MYQAYVYLIRNTLTDQFYYGSRAGNIRKKLQPEDDLWKEYFTSSKQIKQQIEYFGVGMFEAVILYRNEDYQICYWNEQRLIKGHIKHPLNLNKTFVDPVTSKRMVSS